jgi:hypothetical protein
LPNAFLVDYLSDQIIMKLLFHLALFGFFAVECRPRAVVSILDTTKPITLTVSPRDARPAKGFSVEVKGRIDGTATIWNSQFGTNTLSGKIDVRYSDNHSTNFILNYVPQNVRTGEVRLEYVFY